MHYFKVWSDGPTEISPISQLIGQVFIQEFFSEAPCQATLTLQIFNTRENVVSYLLVYHIITDPQPIMEGVHGKMQSSVTG